jgi:hypothetical protein
MRCISIVRPLYFKIFSDSFLITFIFPETVMPIHRHDPFQARSKNCKMRLLASSLSACLTVSVCPPFRPPAWNNSAPTGRIFMKFCILFFENLSRKFKFHENLAIITGNLRGL